MNYGVVNLIALVICSEFFLNELPVEGLMAAFSAFALDSGSRPYQSWTSDHIERDTREMLP